MTVRTGSTLGGLALAGAVYWLTWHFGLSSDQSWTAAVTVLCMAWWVSEALPSAATALVPLVVFPFAGVLSQDDVAAAYGDPVIFLFMGAFMTSKAVEHWGAHRRIAHAMLSSIGGTSGPRILLALMLTTTLCSFWINNTAIALMMLPVALATLEHDKSGKLAVPLLLGVAYCASIGGIATPIGTAPNGVFQGVYEKITGHTIPFDQWIIVAAAVAMLMMFASWAVLAVGVRGVRGVQVQTSDRWTQPQIRTLVVFGVAALGWITREVPFGGWSQFVPTHVAGPELGTATIAIADTVAAIPVGAWLRLLPLRAGTALAGDMTVAVAAALAMFLIPSGEKNGTRLLDWKTAVTIPWGVLILFGGGIAIASAFSSSGLSKIIGEAVTGIRDWPPLALIGVLCLATTFLSEVTSNTATANILMPILGAAAGANGMDPALLMFPATLANSLAFMMPVGTPPNAIVYGTGKVRIIDMVRYGFVLNLIGVVIVTLVCWQLLPLVFGVAASPTQITTRRIPIPQNEHGNRNFESMVIETSGELDAFLKEVSAQDAWNQKDEFLTAMKHADIDFQTDALVFARYTLGSGSYKVLMEQPEVNGKELQIRLTRDSPRSGTKDMAYHGFALAVPKSSWNRVRISTTDDAEGVVLDLKSQSAR